MRRITAVSVAASAVSSFVFAKPAIAGKPIKLNPDAAYVLVEVHDVQGGMKGVKIPGSLTIARYDPLKGDVRGGNRSPAADNETIRIVFSSRPVAKQKGRRQFLVELHPDTWVIEGANNTAFSLGSYTFNVGRGEVVDLGVFVPYVDMLDGEKAPSLVGTVLSASLFGMFGRRAEPQPLMLEYHTRGQADLPVPALLNGRILTQPELKSGARFGNYLGGLINRFGGRKAREPSPEMSQRSSSEAVSTK